MFSLLREQHMYNYHRETVDLHIFALFLSINRGCMSDSLEGTLHYERCQTSTLCHRLFTIIVGSKAGVAVKEIFVRKRICLVSAMCNG
jgi:hypothetical protein